MPKGKSPNWVYNNHDRSRVVSKFGKNRADQMIMLTTVLPGIVIVYQGEEISIENRPMTWDETVDPAGCNLGPNRYYLGSRDPYRSPFQWDNTTSAGFSTNNKTWLPVHNNYKTLNLETQKIAKNSHYKIFKKVVALKQKRVVREGKIQFINIDEKVLIVIRHLDEDFEKVKGPDQQDLAVLLINFTNDMVRVNLSNYLNVKNLTVYVASLESHIEVGSKIEEDHIDLPQAASVIFVNN
ncbi:unnamed protein product [Macrosiphum euphorbiae]|uniref:Glycosyl hydrolase family 13 catalytic domain-containing protein n=1 Tax=Macrosiphum euphorbiae TaxID=13131 RepID=A0AAV0XJK2_9HEMI|nr:unnamed protein product [Macrosiphum euphorbiae]